MQEPKKYSKCCGEKIDLVMLDGFDYEQMVCMKCMNPARPELTEEEALEKNFGDK